MNDIHPGVLAGSFGFMGLWTFVVLMVMFRRRVAALKAKEIRPNQFKTYETEDTMPALVVQASRHYKNLFEMPMLFYAIVLFAIITQASDSVTSLLAIGFCVSRVAHSYVHLGANNVFHRMRVFAASILCLAALWVYVVGKYFL